MKTKKNRLKKIAEGSGGIIYMNLSKKDQIMKVAHNLSADDSGIWLDGPISTYDMLKREAKAHKIIYDTIKHDKDLVSHIPKFISYNDSRHTLIMEKKEGKNLQSLIESNYIFSKDELYKIFLQIAEFFKNINKYFKKFIHGDFNPANVLISFDPIHVSFIDFAYAGSSDNKLPIIEETKNKDFTYDFIRLICYTMAFMDSHKYIENKKWLAKLASIISQKPSNKSQLLFENEWFEGKVCNFQTRIPNSSKTFKTYDNVIKIIKSIYH